MSEKDKQKYYWLKLEEDFFKRHDIKIVEAMPNGKDYIIFYLKLICESTSHEGRLRFNDNIPYNEGMLATITNTNIDIVRSAIQIFSQLQMIEVLDDGTYYMSQVAKMIGSETGSAKRKREYRDSKNNQIGTIVGQCPLEIDIEKEIDIDISSLHSLISVCACEMKISDADKDYVLDFIEHNHIKEVKYPYEFIKTILSKKNNASANEEPEWLGDYNANIEQRIKRL